MTDKSKQVDVALACRKADIVNLQINISGEPEGIGIGLSADELKTQKERNFYQGAKNPTVTPTVAEKPEASEEQSLGERTASEMVEFCMDKNQQANRGETPTRNCNSFRDVNATNVAPTINNGNGNTIIQFFMCNLWTSVSILAVAAAMLLAHSGYSASLKIPATADPVKVHSSSSEMDPTPKKSFQFNISSPNPFFTGRKQAMEDIRAHFANIPQQTRDCWDRMLAIVGLGGMGKTELAYKFAEEFHETFTNVAWINAETESSTLTSFLGLAKDLEIVPVTEKNADLDLVRRVYLHIDKKDYKNVLLIFDNAVRLNLDGKEFGIIEYLPTVKLPNNRYPNILITTQTHDWGKRIKIFQLDELSEEESLKFFNGAFQIESPKCDDLFKKFHQLLEGYPLAMNLAASQIHYDPKNNLVQLRQQISSYINKFQNQNKSILNEEMNRGWPTKYTKTLSTVLQLSLERLEQEENGRDALELLQVMSFFHVPMDYYELLKTFDFYLDCPLKNELQIQLEELLRVLERFYFVRKLLGYKIEDFFYNIVGMHRLVQSVLRQQMDNSQALVRVLLYLTRNRDHWTLGVSSLALEEVLSRTRLSRRELVYVGILACYGVPPASKIFDAMEMEPEMENVATIWRLYKMERGMTTLNENAIQVFRELVRLIESEERLEDRFFIGLFTINLLVDNRMLHHMEDDRTKVLSYFDLDSFQGIEELVAALILSMRDIQTPSCKSSHCNKVLRDMYVKLSHLTAKLSKTFITADAPMATTQIGLIADTFLAVHCKLRSDELFTNPHLESSLDILLNTFCSSAASPSRIDYMGGMNLKDEHVQQVISVFCQEITVIEKEMLVEGEGDAETRCAFAIYVCLTWIKLLLIDDDLPSQNLLESLSSIKALDWIEETSQFIVLKPIILDSDSFILEYSIDPSEYFEQFIKKYSSSDVKQIQKLLNFIALMKAKQLIENLSSVYGAPYPVYGVAWYLSGGNLRICRYFTREVNGPVIRRIHLSCYIVSLQLPRTSKYFTEI